MLEVVVGPEECPDLGVEAEDGSEGEQELQQAQEDVVRQVVVAIPVLMKISGILEYTSNRHYTHVGTRKYVN